MWSTGKETDHRQTPTTLTMKDFHQWDELLKAFKGLYQVENKRQLGVLEHKFIVNDLNSLSQIGMPLSGRGFDNIIFILLSLAVSKWTSPEESMRLCLSGSSYPHLERS